MSANETPPPILSDEDVVTIEALNRAYPHGWRSGDQFTDACTFILARGLRQVMGAIFGGHAAPSGDQP